MISRSIYVNLPNGQITQYLAVLGIEQKNISSYENMDFQIEKNRNNALVSTVTGDFTHAIDFEIFDRSLSFIEQAFLNLSQRGVATAMSDENDEDPEVFHLWRDGQKKLVRIVEDDDAGQLHILDPLGDAGLS